MIFRTRASWDWRAWSSCWVVANKPLLLQLLQVGWYKAHWHSEQAFLIHLQQICPAITSLGSFSQSRRIGNATIQLWNLTLSKRVSHHDECTVCYLVLSQIAETEAAAKQAVEWEMDPKNDGRKSPALDTARSKHLPTNEIQPAETQSTRLADICLYLSQCLLLGWCIKGDEVLHYCFVAADLMDRVQLALLECLPNVIVHVDDIRLMI